MEIKTRQDLIRKYIDFFKKKNHKEIPYSSLIPENDPTVLFTTAGMHPLVPFILGQKHPLGNKLVGVQKCIRTGDIKEVGDEVHHTFFEMLGNWSLGDYFKEEQLSWVLEFFNKELDLEKEKLFATKEMERLRSVPFLNFQNGTEETYACSTTHPVSGEQAELNKLRAGQFCRNVSAYGSPPDPDIQWVTVTIKWNNDNNVQQLPLTMDTLIYESGL